MSTIIAETKPQHETPTVLADAEFLAVVSPVNERVWLARVYQVAPHGGRVLVESAEVDPNEGWGPSDELFSDFLDTSIERLGFHRGGPRSVENAPDPTAYSWTVYRIPKAERPAWADAPVPRDFGPGFDDDTGLGLNVSRDADGSLILDYEHKVGKVPGAAPRDIFEVYLWRQDRIERGVLRPGPVTLQIGVANDCAFLSLDDDDQPQRAAALIREAQLLARAIAEGGAAA